MEQDTGPLYVTQEPIAEALAVVSALDQARKIGKDKAVQVELHDAELRYESGEGIVRNARAGSGDPGKKSRFPGVGQTDDSHVGDHLQLEPDPALIAGPPFFRAPRRLVDSAGKVYITPPARASLDQHELSIGLIDVLECVAAVPVLDDRAWWNLQHEVLPPTAGFLG